MKELKTEKGTYQRPTIRLGSLQHPNHLLTTSGEGMGKRNSYEATDDNPFGSCGTITIGGTVYYNGDSFQNGGDTYLATSPLVYSAQ